ncbi:hypothetical protein [Methyloglobulus sp.]|uniref:hypothetical protein n=1 Tax=Methyloglobulus sp. TaxID=2518622 RepID=UPI003988EF99
MMKRIMMLTALLFMGVNFAQADEGDARLSNAINKYKAEKQKGTMSPTKENQTGKDISSNSGVKIKEPSSITSPGNAEPKPPGGANLPPS